MILNFVLLWSFFFKSLGFSYIDRYFEVDSTKSGFIYPSKSKEFRNDIPSVISCASFCVHDNATLFSYNDLNKTCMTYSRQICDGDTAEPDIGAELYNEAVGSCEETSCSGKYTIKLCNAEVKVKCEHDMHGNKWTVIQQRQNIGGFNFDRTWNEYKYGFGDLDKEFWIGNDALHCLTQDGGRELRIQFVSTSGAEYDANYKRFIVDSESNQYKGYFDNFTGNAYDKLSTNTGGKFSTKDQDNDMFPTIHCGLTYEGGWWYHSPSHKCGNTYLNSMKKFLWGIPTHGVPDIQKTKMMIK